MDKFYFDSDFFIELSQLIYALLCCAFIYAGLCAQMSEVEKMHAEQDSHAAAQQSKKV